MLHPSISRNSTVQNGIYPNQFGVGDAQLATTPFKAFKSDKLTLAFTESFSLRVGLTTSVAQTIKAFVDTVPVTDLHVLDKSSTHINVSNGVITYDGSEASGITLGGPAGKPVIDGVIFGVSDFVNALPMSPEFTLKNSETGNLYTLKAFTTNSSNHTLALYKWVAGSLVGITSFAMGRAFANTDIIGFRVSPAKIEVLINGVSQWEKARSWTVTLSSADLGTIADTPSSPYAFGQSVDLTTSTKEGNYTLSFQNQEGTAYKIDQSIEIVAESAPQTTPVSTQELIIPLLAASLTNSTGTTPIQAAETTDWGKILTWGGVALAGLLLLAGVVWAVRSK